VHADMGGALVLTTSGQVMQYDFETGNLSQADERWSALALSKAARTYPALKALTTSRPTGAVTCSVCNGTGILWERADCETCWGRGWTVK